MPQTLWMVEAAFPFTTLSGGGITVQTAKGEPTHFCPVFTSKEEAETWAAGKYRVVQLISTSSVS